MSNHRTRLVPTALLALALCVATITGCGSSTSEGNTVEKEEDVVLQEDTASVTDKDSTDAEKDAEVTQEETVATDETADAATTDDAATSGAATDAAATTGTQAEDKRVGSDGIGYVTIPATWMEFKDTDGNSSLQWCDGTPYTVISLNTFNMDSVPEDQRESFGPENAAESVWMNMINDGADEESIQGAHVKLAGRDAVQVYGVYPDGGFLVTWLLTDDAGTIRYVSAEGTQDTISDTVSIVESTYEL